MAEALGNPVAAPAFVRRLPLRFLVTLLAFAALPVLLLTDLFSTLPLRGQRDADKGYVVAALPEMALPSALREGDVIDLPAMTVEARAALVGVGNMPEGLRYDIAVLRDGERLIVPVTSVADRTRYTRLNTLAVAPISFGLFVLLLLTLWRGRDWSAWGLSLFAFGILLQNLLQNLPLPVLPNLALFFPSVAVSGLLTLPGLYVAADALVGPGLGARARRRLRGALVLLVVISVGFSLLSLALRIFAGSTALRGFAPWSNLLVMIMAALPVIALAIGYRHSDAERRLRMRWVFWSMGLIFAVVAVQAGQLDRTSVAIRLALDAVVGLSLAGMLYAVLRHRLIDVSFVIDRTLVYGLTTGFVVGAFALVEQVIERFAVGNDASLLLQAGTTLIVALLLNRVHRRVESAVDQLIFRKQHRGTTLLRDFARQCADIEQPGQLLSQALARIVIAIGDAGVAVYGRDGGEDFDCLAARVTTTPFPATVARGDAALRALRASWQPVELTACDGTALGTDGWAFATVLRGEVSGALVVLPPRAVQLTPDQRTTLADLAQELGVARRMLQAHAHEQFIAALAAGAVDAPRDEARRLLGAGVAG